MKHCAAVYGNAPGLLLDVAPQDHEGARPFFPDHITVKTLDINPESGCDFIADICQRNAHIAGGTFDFVVCTEVLEHTLNPFRTDTRNQATLEAWWTIVWEHALQL